MLFDGEAAISNAPAALGPWQTLLFAFDSVKQMFVVNRPFTEPRQQVIAVAPALQERAMAKSRALVAAVTSALCKRGIAEPDANLLTWMGMAASSYGVAAWFRDSSTDLGEHMRRAFQQVSRLAQLDAVQARTKARSSETGTRGRKPGTRPAS